MKGKLLVVALLVLVGVLVMGSQEWDVQARDQGGFSTDVLASESPTGFVTDPSLMTESWSRGVAGADPLAMVRRSTAGYHRIEMAEQEGFVPLFDCIASLSDTSQGAMGVHYILPSRFDDQLHLDEPEVLIYEPQADGRMRLVAVEFVIPSAAWPEDADPPEFLGQELKYKTTMGKYGAEDGIEPYYEVHAWVWKYNPSGVFADWNPAVSCSS